MGKRKGIILTQENKQKAIENGISLKTVYARLSRGWSEERAVSEIPLKTTCHSLPRSKDGSLAPSKIPKGKQRSIRLYKNMDEDIDKAIAESGLSQSDFVSMAMEEYYHKLWKIKKTKIRQRK